MNVPNICSRCFHPPENHRPDGCAAMELPEHNFRIDCDCTELRSVPLIDLYPTAVFDDAGCFQGHRDSPCEHRTTGGRAWCFDDSEWCYPHDGCRCCAEQNPTS